MNSKQFINILIVVAVIGAIGFFLKDSREKSWKDSASGGGEKVVGEDFDVNSVAGITIKNSDGELNVAKVGDAWVVKERGGYAAKFTTIVDFVRKFGELKVIQKQPIGASAFARMEVNEPGSGEGAGTLVELKDKDGKALKSLILGKQVMKKAESNSPFGGGDHAVGRWVLNPADKENILTVSETFSDADTDAGDWLNKDFFAVENLKSIAVTSSTNDHTWTVNREKFDGDWKLAGLKKDEETDSAKMSSIGNPLNSPSFQDVVTDKKDDELGLDKAVKVAMTTFDGFKYDLQIGSPTDDNDYPVKVAISAELAEKRTPGKDEKDEDKEKLDQEFGEKLTKLKAKLATETGYAKWTYMVSKWTVDAFFKKRSEFIKTEEAEEATPAGMPSVPTPLLNPPSVGTVPGLPKNIESLIKVPEAPKPVEIKPVPATKPTAPKAAPTKAETPKGAAPAKPASAKKEAAKTVEPVTAKKEAVKATKPAPKKKPAAKSTPKKPAPAKEEAAKK